ncbi:MAG: GntR family transcriptional regulator [Hyphomicrobiaceae bacterium]
MKTELTVHLAVPKPLYGQVRDAILRRIRQGEWTVGETLPNEFVLASDFGVSIGTIRRAIAGLEEGGIVKRVQGRGTFVAGPGASPLQEKFSRIRRSDGAAAGLAYAMLSVIRRQGSEDERARLLGNDQGDVIEVRQVVSADGHAVGLERSVLSASAFPRLETQIAYGQHLYPMMADYGVLVSRASEDCSLALLDAATAEALGQRVGSPVLAVRRTAYAFPNEAVELMDAVYHLPAGGLLVYACTVH